MKFYKRFPGDITIKTGDLSLTEFGAYDRLLDHYYAKETPIDPARVYTVTRCQSASDRRAVDAVLLEYWTLTPLGWVQQRADEMIAEAAPRIEAARENGKKGGRPTKAQTAKLSRLQEPAGFSLETQEVPETKTSQSQNQKGSVPNGTDGGEPPAPKTTKIKSPEDIAKTQLWRAAVAVLAAGGCPNEAVARSFMGKLVKDYGLEPVREAIAAAATEQPADAREYLKATCMHLAKERTRPVTVAENPQVQETAAAHAAEAARVGSNAPEHINAARAAAAAARERRLGSAKEAVDAVTGARDAHE